METFSGYTSATPPTTLYRIYNYDSAGNVTGRSDWPEDIRVNLVQDSTGSSHGSKRKSFSKRPHNDADLKDATGRRTMVKVELATPALPAQPYSEDNL